MVSEFAQSIINTVHSLWEHNRDEYTSGYAVFYGPVYSYPDLMLIGLNPGGDEKSFSGMKERLASSDEPMEYIIYCNDKNYPIAVKTFRIFESIGLLNVLSTSVKTNINFFRSKNWNELSKNHFSKCLNIVLQIIEHLKPKAILCESIRVYDIILKNLSESYVFTPNQRAVNKKNCRIYFSDIQKSNEPPYLLIGIRHLTGSRPRPSPSDIEQIEKLLSVDLSQTSVCTATR